MSNHKKRHYSNPCPIFKLWSVKTLFTPGPSSVWQGRCFFLKEKWKKMSWKRNKRCFWKWRKKSNFIWKNHLMGHHLPAACLVLFAVDDQSSLDQVAQFPQSWQLCFFWALSSKYNHMLGLQSNCVLSRPNGFWPISISREHFRQQFRI